jgi:ATP-dependent protease ClpP protease subunit
VNKILSLTALMIVASLIALSVGKAKIEALGSKRPIVLTEDNVVNIRTEINSESVMTTELELARLDTIRGDKTYPIYLVLDTPGGSISDGSSLIEFAKTIKNLKTISIFAASMGSAIVQALPGERIVMANSTMMFHRAAGRFQGQFGEGEVEQQLAFWKSIVASMEVINANRLQMTLEDYRQKAKDQFWIYGADNLTKHSADRIALVKCSQDLIDAREEVEVQISIFSAVAIYSKCPLVAGPLKLKE